MIVPLIIILPAAVIARGDDSILNPFYAAGGCLRSVLGPEEFPWKRVCNSDDSRYADDPTVPSTATDAVCDEPDFDYQEIRIQNQDWDGPMMSTWIMQILLSELLHVPTSVETSSPSRHYNFYDPLNRADSSTKIYNFESLHAAHQTSAGDCRELQSARDGEYQGCANVFPMVSKIGQASAIQKMRDEGIIGLPKMSGNADQYRWWVPKILAKEDPSILSHYGLRGEGNRHKLAELFKRPTTWGEYCAQVSLDNCTAKDGEGDGTAARAPQDEDEAGKYYVGGLYKGHFRATDKNNCTTNPDTCTGHFTNVPCSWGNYAVPQIYHLGIALESDGPLEPSGGYGYTSLFEIWAAANATKSNVIMYWWEPEASMELYRGTDFEFIPIFLPLPTKECLTNRVTGSERCSTNFTDQVGSPLGSCDAGAVDNLMLTTLDRDCSQVDGEYAGCSPAHAALQSYEVTNVDLQDIYKYRSENPRKDGREAVCKWFVENLDVIRERFVPNTYPREKKKEYSNAFYNLLTCFAIALAALSMLGVSICAVGSKFFEKTKVMICAQVDFLLLILSGLFLVAASALLFSVPPSMGVCAARPWFVAVGYSLELIPLAVKVAAINKIFQQSRKMKRVQVKKKQLYQIVGGCILGVCVYLATWTAVDPPIPQTQLTLTNEKSEEGNFVVDVSGFCASSTRAWWIATSIYLLVLLIISAAIATQNRGIRQDFNESRYLAFMLYSHLMFVLFRTIFFIMSDKFANPNTVSATISILLSLDICITIGIYFVPKLIEAKKSRDKPRLRRSAGALRQVIDRRDSLEESDPQSFSWAARRDSSTLSTSGHYHHDGDVEDAENHGQISTNDRRVSWRMDVRDFDPDKYDPKTHQTALAGVAEGKCSGEVSDEDIADEEEITEEGDHLLESYDASGNCSGETSDEEIVDEEKITVEGDHLLEHYYAS